MPKSYLRLLSGILSLILVYEQLNWFQVINLSICRWKNVNIELKDNNLPKHIILRLCGLTIFLVNFKKMHNIDFRGRCEGSESVNRTICTWLCVSPRTGHRYFNYTSVLIRYRSEFILIIWGAKIVSAPLLTHSNPLGKGDLECQRLLPLIENNLW